MPGLRQRTYRYTTLLIAELLLILIYPFVSGADLGREIFRMAAIVLFSAALYAVLGKGRITLGAFLLGTPAIALRILNLVTGAGRFQLADEVLAVLFLLFVTSVLAWTILSSSRVTADTLAGAVAAYLLIGITFGLMYMLVAHLAPGSFRDTIEPGKQLPPTEYTFFSFMTLTTVGYGDIVPWMPQARALAVLEAVIGIMYPALLIGRLVGLHVGKRENG
jgi:voltage-gated potassium channel Kch